MRIEPGYIQGHCGKLFLVNYYPDDRARGRIIFIPPLHEEMNRSRHMIATSARRFASEGFHCQVFDLYGTGDSEGLINEARLSTWLEDIDCVVQDKQNIPLSFWSLRAGSLLGSAYLTKYKKTIDHFILWQPLLDGAKQVAHLKRFHKASNLLAKENVDKKDHIEIGGYAFQHALLSEINSLQFRSETFAHVKRMHMMTVSLMETSPTNLLSYFRDNTKDKIAFQHHHIRCAPFWTTQELEFAPELIEASCQSL